MMCGMSQRWPTNAAVFFCSAILSQSTRAEATDADALAKAYRAEIRPLVTQFCNKCHSGDRIEAEIDLALFTSLTDVRKQPKIWQKVREALETGQMPPKGARQPADAERNRLRQWVREYLTLEARSRAGDPGRVVLRRLNNAEFTYTIRDLTGVSSLRPAREFPVDGAAGEGFTNTGNALVMSPSLVTKYLDAAKEIAAHAVLLPDGFRFSPSVTRSDWTNQLLADIRQLYSEFTDSKGATRVNLQGIILDTNDGGRLPLEKYLLATLAERESLLAGRKTTAAVANERGLSPKYLATLWKSLVGGERSFLLDGLRQRWSDAKPEDAATLAAEVGRWQQALWKVSSVGHIGKAGGPKRWLEPVSPLSASQDIRFKIPATENAEVSIYLVASDAGDGNEHDYVIWQQPRLVMPGQKDLLLRDVRHVARDLTVRRTRVLAETSKYLQAADEAAAHGPVEIAALAGKHGLEPEQLRAWLDYLGIGTSGPIKIDGLFTTKIPSVAGYDFVKGWGSGETPLLLANSSDRHVRVPGNMKPHGVVVHPSPTLRTAVGWRSPVTAKLRVEPRITHAHPECGNGVTWSLELRRGANRQRLATGTAHGGTEVKPRPVENLSVQPGDLISLLIGSRDGNHACDLTAVDLKLTTSGNANTGNATRTWNLADDVANDIHAGNPHADRMGNADVWHFYTELDKSSGDFAPVVPVGSLLAKWQSAREAKQKLALAAALQKLLTSKRPASKESPDAALHRQLTSLGGPLFHGMVTPSKALNSNSNKPEAPAKDWGLDPAVFGKHPNGTVVDSASLCVRAPSVIEIRLPADLVAGRELVTTGALEQVTGAEGSVQLQALANKPSPDVGLIPSELTVTAANGQWTSNNWRGSHSTPIVANENSAARKRIEASFDKFRSLFPAALCYSRIVPVDEVVTLTLYYREDDHLARLMLDDAQQARLNRLWDELHFISQDALTLVNAYTQLMEFATQDADPKVFEPLRQPINARAAAFRKLLVESEPKQLDALLAFAARSYRRPLSDAETRELRGLYRHLREEKLPHEEAFRLTLARVLVAPAFLYRLERPVPGSGQGVVSDWELANRLSYFLWSSIPDDELRALAAAGKLRDPNTLAAQTKRMLRDPRTRRLATEFACQWLHIGDFDQLNEKSERHFPTFASLRGAMFEESIQFFTYLFQNDRSALEIVDADYTFLNEKLAKHYGIPGVAGEQWRRIDDVRKFSRGGVLTQSTTLAKQSGASRTSPILRGNWLSEVVLGEKLPRPPKDVPVLADVVPKGLTERQLVEQHTQNAACAKCHARIDPFGFALENFDAIGRFRSKDAGGLAIDTRTTLPDGTRIDGLSGLRDYLLTARRDAFVNQFCRKLLGYALGRAVQLSDEPLIADMQAELKAKDYHIGAAVEMIVRSRQFREIRGLETAYED